MKTEVREGEYKVGREVELMLATGSATLRSYVLACLCNTLDLYRELRCCNDAINFNYNKCGSTAS